MSHQQTSTIVELPDWYRSNLLLKQRNARLLEASDRLATEAKQTRSIAKMMQSIAMLRLYNQAEDLRWEQLRQQMELKGIEAIPGEWEVAGNG